MFLHIDMICIRKEKKTMLLLNKLVTQYSENIIRFSNIELLLYKKMNKQTEFS